MKTYPIRMTAPNIAAINEGRKTATRRTNRKWLKLKKGDRLRVLGGKGLYLVVTTDAYVQRLHDMTQKDVVKEGVLCPEHDCDGGFCVGPCYHLNHAWVTLWDSINGDKPGMAFHDNPKVVVIEFEKEERK